MKSVFFFLLSFLYILSADSQTTFSKSIDVDGSGEIAVALKVEEDGYWLLASSTCYPLFADCFEIVKTNLGGEKVWDKMYHNYPLKFKPGTFRGNNGIVLTQDGGAYISGLIEFPETSLDIFLMKTDANGDSILFRTYGSPYIDINGAVFFRTDTTLLLYSDLALAPNDDDIVWLLETDLEGNVVWEKTYGDSFGMVGVLDIEMLGNGDLVFSYLACYQSGACDGSTPNSTIGLYLARINMNGEELWTKKVMDISLFYPPYQNNCSLVVLDDGGFLLSFFRDNSDGGWFFPPILIWLDSMGNFVQQYDFPAETERAIHQIHKTSSGTVIGAGLIDRFDADLGIGGWVFGMTQQGELLWERQIFDLRFPLKESFFTAFEEAPDGGLILTGFIQDTFPNHEPFINNPNIWLVKLDSAGCLEPDCDLMQIVGEPTQTRYSNESRVFKIYPNPARNVVYLEKEETFGFKARFADLMGKVFLEANFQAGNRQQFDISLLPPGIYFLWIENEDGELVQVEKIVIQN